MSNSTLTAPLIAERESKINAFVHELTEWAEAHGRAAAPELEAVGKHLFLESGRYRKRLSVYNWYKKAYKARHRELAEEDGFRFGVIDHSSSNNTELPTAPTKKDCLAMMNKIAVREWNKIKQDPIQYANLVEEYNAADAYIHATNTPPRSPTKLKLKTMARSRKDGKNYIVKALEGVSRYAEDNAYDIACYVADRSLADCGGESPIQLGTTAGVKFILTLASKGISGDLLQILAQSCHANLSKAAERGPQILGPNDSLADAFPSLTPTLRADGSQQFVSKSRQTLNKSIRILIKTQVNRVVKSREFVMTESMNIPGTALRLEKDLEKRGVKVVFKDGCRVTMADLADYRASPVKLEEVYGAIWTNMVTFESITENEPAGGTETEESSTNRSVDADLFLDDDMED